MQLIPTDSVGLKEEKRRPDARTHPFLSSGLGQSQNGPVKKNDRGRRADPGITAAGAAARSLLEIPRRERAKTPTRTVSLRPIKLLISFFQDHASVSERWSSLFLAQPSSPASSSYFDCLPFLGSGSSPSCQQHSTQHSGPLPPGTTLVDCGEEAPSPRDKRAWPRVQVRLRTIGTAETHDDSSVPGNLKNEIPGATDENSEVTGRGSAGHAGSTLTLHAALRSPFFSFPSASMLPCEGKQLNHFIRGSSSPPLNNAPSSAVVGGPPAGGRRISRGGRRVLPQATTTAE